MDLAESFFAQLEMGLGPIWGPEGGMWRRKLLRMEFPLFFIGSGYWDVCMPVPVVPKA